MIGSWISAGVLLALFLYYRWMLVRALRTLTLTILRERGDWMAGMDLVHISGGVIPRGMVYVILMRLTDDGVVEHRFDHEGRIWYRIKR